MLSFASPAEHLWNPLKLKLNYSLPVRDV